jgi:streptogramin lyase
MSFARLALEIARWTRKPLGRRGSRKLRQSRRETRLEMLESRALLAAITEFAASTPNALPVGIASGIVLVPGGSLWFTEPGVNKIGEMTTAGVPNDFPITTPNSSPTGITFGPNGNLWFTESAVDQIGEMSTSGKMINTFPIGGSASDPQGITVGHDGNLWFTQAATGQIGRLNPTTGQIAEFSILTPGGQPASITSGPDGNLWFTEPGANKIGEISPSTGAVTEFAINTAGGHPQGITTGPEGNLWFTESGAAKVGNISPTTNIVTEYAVPSPGGVTEGITAGADGNLWFTEPGTAEVGQITAAGAVTEFALPTKASQPWGITTGPDGNVWFTEPGANNVAQVALARLIEVSPISVMAQVGTSSSLTVASFMSAAVNPQPGNFSATINWGDGTTSSGTITTTTNASGQEVFLVSATKTYSTVGVYLAKVTVTDGEGATASTGSTVTVANSAVGATINPVEGQPFSRQVATFSDPQTTGQAGQYSASINWGDGTPATVGVIVFEGGTIFSVAGRHIYAMGGPYNIVTTITGPNGRTFVAYSQALIDDAPLRASAVTINPTAGVPFTGVVANFIDEDPLGTLTDYSATITWGDGHVSQGTIGGPTKGAFTVTGTNTYTTPGSYPLSVTIVDVGGSQATATSTVVVGAVRAAISGFLSPASISGPNSSLNITNVNRPTFQGIASPYAIVQLFAQRSGSDPTNTIAMGQTIAGADGSWSLSSAATLPDGSYIISASMTPEGGSPTAPVLIVGPANPLVIDTIAPRVAGLSFNTHTGIITVVISDAGSGLYGPSLTDPANYTIVLKRGLSGSNSDQPAQLSPAISGWYTVAQAATLQFKAPLAAGKYLFQVKSGGVIDNAGNALDGEFTGHLPSGDGRPGGNFIVQVIVPKHHAPKPRKPARKFH